jgi:hypothetical protein
MNRHELETTENLRVSLSSVLIVLISLVQSPAGHEAAKTGCITRRITRIH